MGGVLSSAFYILTWGPCVYCPAYFRVILFLVPHIVNPESWNMDLGRLMLGSPILYLKCMRTVMFQLSGFYDILKLPHGVDGLHLRGELR